jgi:hypothetical protein
MRPVIPQLNNYVMAAELIFARCGPKIEMGFTAVADCVRVSGALGQACANSPLKVACPPKATL